MLEASDEPVRPAPALPRIEIATTTPAARRSLPPPPPEIGHLMLWVACCALYMAVMRRMFAVEPGLLGLLILAAIGLSTSLSWAGLAILMARLVGGKRWPIEPGQWLLAALGAQFALEALLLFVPPVVHSPQHVVDALTCCLLVLPLLGKLSRQWMMAFSALIVVTALPLLMLVLTLLRWIDLPPLPLWSSLTLVQSIAMAVIVLLAAAIDRRQPPGYGWLHWLGLYVFVYYQAVRISFVVLDP